MSEFFDTHTHLNMGFDIDWREVGERTLNAGISFINVGADEQSSRLALEQVKELRASAPKGALARSSAGIHPTEGGESDFSTIIELARDEQVVAIGECGLEYFNLKDDSDKIRQKELFRKHIDLAIEVGKPLIIHCRANPDGDAYDDVLEILTEYKKRVGDKLQFNMHFFTGTWANAEKFLNIGGYLSFPGVITFTNQYDEVIKKAPLDRIMAETDAPFAAPVPHRGERNEPAYVQFVAERIVELRAESKEEAFSALVENSERFYQLSK